MVARALAEEHRQHLTKWFYDCSYEMHRGIADLFGSDPRYTKTWDAYGEGFSQYVREAIYANAESAAA